MTALDLSLFKTASPWRCRSDFGSQHAAFLRDGFQFTVRRFSRGAVAGELSEKLRKNFQSALEPKAPPCILRAGQGALWRHVNMLRKILSAAALGAAVVVTSTLSASAAIMCQGNVCWHTHEAFGFPHEAGVVVHEDNWHWGPHEKFAFHEHEGRGYWRGGKWVGW